MTGNKDLTPVMHTANKPKMQKFIMEKYKLYNERAAMYILEK